MIKELIVAAILIALAVLVVNPFGLWMPDMAGTAIAAGLFIAFAVFVGLVWREHAADEREAAHQMAAGRLAYLAGTGVLVFAVAMQAMAHMLDGRVVAALVAMIVVKIGARMWYEVRN